MYCRFRDENLCCKTENMDESQVPPISSGEQEQGSAENNETPVIQEQSEQQPGEIKEQKPSNGENGATSHDTVTEKKQRKESAAGSTRLTLVGNFVGDEIQYLNRIIEARKKSGLTENVNHFVRQCIDFAVNHVPGTTFAVPSGEKTPIKNAFYK